MAGIKKLNCKRINHSLESNENNKAVIRFTGSCRNDGTNLSPDNLVYMLEQIAKIEVQLLKVHRQQLILN